MVFAVAVAVAVAVGVAVGLLGSVLLFASFERFSGLMYAGFFLPFPIELLQMWVKC